MGCSFDASHGWQRVETPRLCERWWFGFRYPRSKPRIKGSCLGIDFEFLFGRVENRVACSRQPILTHLAPPGFAPMQILCATPGTWNKFFHQMSLFAKHMSML